MRYLNFADIGLIKRKYYVVRVEGDSYNLVYGEKELCLVGHGDLPCHVCGLCSYHVPLFR